MRPRSKYRLARALQIGAYISLGIVVMYGIGLLGVASPMMFGAGFVLAAPLFIMPLFLRCEGCAASYYYDEKFKMMSMGPLGYNLLRPVRATCPRCGLNRSNTG